MKTVAGIHPKTSLGWEGRVRRSGLFLSLCLFGHALCLNGLAAQGIEKELSLDDLLNLPVSSASKYSQRSSDAPANITIITAEEIERYGFRTVADALETLTSFSVSSDHVLTYTGVRGFARPADYNNRVLILIDGHTENENVLGAGELGNIRLLEMGDIDRIEVVRGPGSSLYGTRAMFAVVNLISKKGSDVEGVEAWGDLGSFGSLGAGLRAGHRFQTETDLFFSASWSEQDGDDFYFPEYDTPTSNQGVAEGLAWDETLRAMISLAHGNWTFWGAANSRDGGNPTAPHGSVFNDPRARMGEFGSTLDLEYEKEISAPLSFTQRFYGNFHKADHLYPVPQNAVGLHVEARWIGAETRARWDLGPNHRIVVGSEFQRTHRALWKMDDELGQTDFSGDFPYSILSAFLQDEFQVTSGLALTLGVRHDRYEGDLSKTAPRVAVVYHPWEGSTLKVLWGNAFRAPNIYEMNFESAYASHLRNPDLRSEEISSTEVVWEQRLATGLAAKVGLFRNDVSHFIDQVAVERPSDWGPSPTGLPFALRFENSAEIRAEGIESEVNASFGNGFLGYLRYAIQRAEERSSGAGAPNYPAHSLKIGGTHRLRGLGSLGTNYLWESSRLTLSGAETESYSVLNASINSELIGNRIRVSLTGKNLLNTKYSLPTGPQHTLLSIPQEGRSFQLRVGVEW